MRGRSSNNNSSNSNHRRGPNPLTRSYESNGPDTKVRGTAAHIAEKYVQLARDAHVASDPVAAENYLQHAEHYFRLIATAQAALNPPPRITEGISQAENGADEGDDDDFDGGINDRFTYHSPQSYQAPQVNTAESGNETQVSPAMLEQPSVEPYESNDQQRSFEPRHPPRNEYRNEGRNGSRFEGRSNNRDRNSERMPRGEFPRSEPRYNEPRFSESRHNEPRHNENRYQNNAPSENRPERSFEPLTQENGRHENMRPDNNRYEASRRDRQPRTDRSFEPRASFENRNSFDSRPDRNSGERNERPARPFTPAFTPEIADVQPILPSFITAPVRIAATEPVLREQISKEKMSTEQVQISEPVKVKEPKQSEIQPQTELSTSEKPVPKPRRKRIVKAHDDAALPLEPSLD